jgi:hypothetical protein
MGRRGKILVEEKSFFVGLPTCPYSGPTFTYMILKGGKRRISF